MIEWEYFRIV